MPTRPPLICPRCGATMNRHAEKLILSSPADPGVDPALGGYVEEMHTCPGCGQLGSRR